MAQRRPGLLPLSALAAILVITAAFWALALWPVADASPEWLTRTRVACFRLYDDGLPDAAGWLELIGQPLGMLAVLFAVWGRQVRDGLRALGRSRWGRSILFGSTLAIALGIAGVVVRVGGAIGADELLANVPPSASYPRLDRAAPPLELVDQSGAAFHLERLRGRPVLITFAYAHCETVCPLLVSDLLNVRRRFQGSPSGEAGLDTAQVPYAVVVTLDPWRDTPARLPAIAEAWGLESDAYLLGGEPLQVEATLDAWGVDRWRDDRTGEIAHPALVYILDREGRIAFAAHGGVDPLVELLRRL